jgi:hypothetical protein
MVEDTNMTKRENDDILNSDMDKREFKVTVGIRSYWITKEELEKYLKERKVPGVDLVALRGGLLFLPTQCQEIAHRSVMDDSEKIDNKRWRCESGNWHANGNDCMCNVELVEGNDGMVRIQEKVTHQLPLPEYDTNRNSLRSRTLQVKSF